MWSAGAVLVCALELFGHDTQRVPALRQLRHVERVPHLTGSQEQQLKQFVDWRRGQRLALLGRQRRQPMSGLGRNHNARTTAASP